MKTKYLSLFLAILLCFPLFALPVSASEIEVDVAETPITQSSETTEPDSDIQQVAPTSSEILEQPVSTESIPTEKEPATIYPTDIRYDSLGAKRYIYKTYKLPENTGVDSVTQLPYQEDGYHWKNTEVILKETIVNSDTKEIVEPVELVCCKTGQQAGGAVPTL